MDFPVFFLLGSLFDGSGFSTFKHRGLREGITLGRNYLHVDP